MGLSTYLVAIDREGTQIQSTSRPLIVLEMSVNYVLRYYADPTHVRYFRVVGAEEKVPSRHRHELVLVARMLPEL